MDEFYSATVGSPEDRLSNPGRVTDKDFRKGEGLEKEDQRTNY